MEEIEVFVIDAPWEQRKGGFRKIRKRQGRELDYETISVPGIFDLLERDIFRLQQVTIVYSCGRQSDICLNARWKCSNVDTDAIAGWCGIS